MKETLTMAQKIEFVQEVTNNSLDSNPFFNPMKTEIYFVLAVMEFYGGVEIAEEEWSNPPALYDRFMEDGSYENVVEQILEGELDWLRNMVEQSLRSIHEYNNSFAGIMANFTNNFQDLDGQVSEMAQKLSDPDSLKLLKDVVTKLG